MNANDPIFSLGFSNGGVFASYAAHLGNWRAAALYCSGPGVWGTTTTVPHIFHLQANDLSLEPSVVANSQTLYARLLAQGIPTQFNFLYSSPLYPNRFWRINPFTSADSNAIYNALKQNGFLDGNDYFIRNPRTSNWEAVIPPVYAPRLSEIEWQIQMAYADHGFSSGVNYRTIQFFNARL